MNRYEVSLKATDKKEVISAKTAQEACYLYCEKYGLNYLLYANKLIAKLIKS